MVLVEETEVRCAERWASVPVDKDVRLLAGVACPAGVTVCEDCVVVPGTVGTLPPSDSGSVGHDGTDPAGILFPAVPAGIPFPVGPDGMLSSSHPAGMLFPAVPAGMLFPAGPDGTLSSSDPAGILFSAIPAGIPFSAGPVGTLSPSDFDFVGPVGPVGMLSLSDHVGVLSRPFLLVSRLQWTLIVTPQGGWLRQSGRNSRTGRTLLLHSCLLNNLSGTLGMWEDMDMTM